MAVYEGDKDYIFISYSRKDSVLVLPVVEDLQSAGFRVWYDSGIKPGSEWSEYIAEHIDSCKAFIAFMSNNSSSSRNCRQEIHYAGHMGKDILVAYIEETQLSSGLAMRTSPLQAIKRWKLGSDAEFTAEIAKVDFLQSCKDSIGAMPAFDVYMYVEGNRKTVCQGEVVTFRVRYDNNGAVDQRNVVMKIILPAELEYIEGTALLFNNNNPEGKAVNDDLVKDHGMNIGHYAGGTGWAEVVFKARISAFAKSGISINCKVTVSTDNGNKHHMAVLFVSDNLKPTTPKKAGWGPQRPTFTNESPAPYPVFNSITNNAAVGDERNFCRIGEVGSDAPYGDMMQVVPGKCYEVYIYYVNDSTVKGAEGTALGVRVSSYFTTAIMPGEWGAIGAVISSSTTDPESVWNGCNIWSDEPVGLTYVPGSAKLYNHELEGELIPDEDFLTCEGALIGSKALDGIIPGDDGKLSSGYILYRLKADRLEIPDGSIEKTASLNGREFSKQVVAQSGEEVFFRLAIRNDGDIKLGNATVKDALPKGMKLVSGSVGLCANDSKVVDNLTDNIIGTGFNLGTIGTGNVIYITYRAMVDGDSFAREAECRNEATLTYDGFTSAGITKHDSATVYIRRDSANETARSSPNTRPTVSDAGLRVMYLGHSGFFVELPIASLLFDWYQGELPPVRNDKPLYVFISHIHSDHFRWDSFNLASRHPNAQVFLGYDYGNPDMNSNLKKLPDFMQDRLSCFNGVQKLYSDDGNVLVSSLESTDLGVAFVVEVEGRRFYHAGDLALWTRPEEEYVQQIAQAIVENPGASIQSYAAYRQESLNEFRRCIEPLRGQAFDFGMLPLDPRLGDNGMETVEEYLSIAEFKAWSPMHLWDQYEYVDRYVIEHPDNAKRMIGVTSVSGSNQSVQPGEWFKVG